MLVKVNTIKHTSVFRVLGPKDPFLKFSGLYAEVFVEQEDKEDLAEAQLGPAYTWSLENPALCNSTANVA